MGSTISIITKKGANDEKDIMNWEGCQGAYSADSGKVRGKERSKLKTYRVSLRFDLSLVW